MAINPSALGAHNCAHAQTDFWHSIDRMSAEVSRVCPHASCSRTLLVHYPLGRALHSKCDAGHFFSARGTYTGRLLQPFFGLIP